MALAVRKAETMKPIVRIPLALLVTSAVISLGVIGVHASEQCVRFIQKRHHHGAATLAAWAAWDKAHPNWHPKNRPVGDTMAALDFACSVPVVQEAIDTELPPIALDLDFPMEMLPPPSTPTVVAENTPPPFFNEAPPLPLVAPPIYSPDYPTLSGLPPIPPRQVSVGVTPEPSTWMLLATGLVAIGGLAARRRIALRPIAAAH
jgi:hypothetical protein